MDILLLRIAKDEKIIHFSAAKRPLWYFSQNTFLEYKGDRYPIGDTDSYKEKLFFAKKIEYQQGDTFYLFTDGMPDQFGKNDKKFMIKRMRQFIAEIHKKNMQEQKIIILEKMEEWQEDLPQTDDWLMFGLRF